MHIDQGLRPWPLEELMCTGLSTGASPAIASSNSVEPSYLGEVTATCGARDDASADGLPRDPVCGFIASEPWFADLRQRWRRLGLRPDQLPSDAREPPNNHEDMLQIVEQLDEFIHLALATPTPLAHGDAGQDASDHCDDDEGVDADHPEAGADDDDSGVESESLDDAEDTGSDQSDMRDAQTYAGGRLTISVNGLVTILDGERIRIETRLQALFLQAVASSPGRIGSTEIGRSDLELDGTRMDKLKRRLDPRLQQIIVSKRGTGYRLML